MNIAKLKRNLHILMLVPFWNWIQLIFIPEFFERFPYDKLDKKTKCRIEVYLVNYFGSSNTMHSMPFEGKLHRAYTKVRLKALSVDWSYPQDCFGVEYALVLEKEKTDE